MAYVPPVQVTVKSSGPAEELDIITGFIGIAANVETHVDNDEIVPPVFVACTIN